MQEHSRSRNNVCARTPPVNPVSARILVIEDDPASLELLKYLLEQAGHTVVSASDGAAGLSTALGDKFDVIFCDIQLPKLNGYEFAERLRATPAWRDVPLIAVTAYSMPGDRDTAIAAGFTEYFPKPIDPETFLQEIDRFLPAVHQASAG